MLAQNSLVNFVRQISQEKGLGPDMIKQAVEQAVVACSKKNLAQFKDARAQLNLETGELQVLVKKRVVEKASNARHEISLKEARKIDKSYALDAEIDVPIEAREFGRVAAQSARQIIMQKLRDAEREKVFLEYKDRTGQVVTGIIQRFERRDAIVNIGDTEGILPYEEQPYGVRYRFGDRIKCIIQSVEMTPRGPYIRLSRNSTDLILKLFALEVPEIAEGIVEVANIAREPGVRTKLAVNSRNPDVDPVGACVGMKGSRVQMIVREFENEKFDIVPYSANPSSFITSALNPAQITRVDLNPEQKTATVIVPQDSLALAIGKRGQNARLAAKLTGWQLDIKSAEEEAEEQAAEEARIHYLTDFLDQMDLAAEARERIETSTFNNVEALAAADPDEIVEMLGGSMELAERVCDNARSYVEALRAMTAEREAAEAKAAQQQAAAAEAQAADKGEASADEGRTGGSEGDGEDQSAKDAGEPGDQPGERDDPSSVRQEA